MCLSACLCVICWIHALLSQACRAIALVLLGSVVQSCSADSILVREEPLQGGCFLRPPCIKQDRPARVQQLPATAMWLLAWCARSLGSARCRCSMGCRCTEAAPRQRRSGGVECKRPNERQELQEPGTKQEQPQLQECRARQRKRSSSGVAGAGAA